MKYIRTSAVSKAVQLGLAALVCVALVRPVLADTFDDQISQLQAQISAQQAQVNSLNQQKDTLSNKVSNLNGQIAAATAQLQLDRAQYAKLSDELAAAEQQLIQKKAVLDESMRTIYLEGQITPIEMLASSSSFSEYVDRQQYLQSLRSNVADAVEAVKAIKVQLESQRKQQADLINQQNAITYSLQQQQNQVFTLLSETQGQEAAYQSMVASTNQKLQAVVAARAEAIRRSGVQFSSSGCGGYPDKWCKTAQDSMADDWNFYNRECVSYVAWKRWALNQSPQPNYWGNAADWYRYVNHYSPKAGDIAVWGANANAYIGSAGHVAYVDGVSGNSVTLSQYNFDVGNGPGRYSRMTLQLGDPILRGVGYIY